MLSLSFGKTEMEVEKRKKKRIWKGKIDVQGKLEMAEKDYKEGKAIFLAKYVLLNIHIIFNAYLKSKITYL